MFSVDLFTGWVILLVMKVSLSGVNILLKFAVFGFVGILDDIFLIQLCESGPDILISASADFVEEVERANTVSFLLFMSNFANKLIHVASPPFQTSGQYNKAYPGILRA